jgi:hypothetical protein
MVRRHGDAGFADHNHPRSRRRSWFRSLRLSGGDANHCGDQHADRQNPSLHFVDCESECGHGELPSFVEIKFFVSHA